MYNSVSLLLWRTVFVRYGKKINDVPMKSYSFAPFFKFINILLYTRLCYRLNTNLKQQQ
jgi:hypothetical protein